MLSNLSKHVVRTCFNYDNMVFPQTTTKSSPLIVYVLSNSLATILANPSHWQQYATWDGTSDRSSGNDKISLSRIIDSVLQTNWSLDSFQNPVLIHTLCQLNCFDKTDTKCLSAYEMLLKRRSRLVHHRSVSKLYLTFSIHIR